MKTITRCPVHRLKKAEIVWLGSHFCRHGHTYLEHYSCYLKEHPEREKVGFLDIETSNLDADFGIILSYCIKEKDGKIIGDIIKEKDLRSNNFFDKRLVEKCIEDMLKFDRIITWYGRKFDIPFIRTRALINGIDFPNYGTIIHNDDYYIARYRLKLHSNRLENVERVIFGETGKTHIESKYWIKALQGDKKSLNYIFDHNKKDVISLEKNHNKLINFVSNRDTSI